MIVTHTIKDIICWAIEYKRGNAFKNMTNEEIAYNILEAYKRGALMVDSNNRGEIFGILIYERQLYINQLLTSSKYSMKNLLLSLKDKFPDVVTAYAFRKNKIKKYSNKLAERL